MLKLYHGSRGWKGSPEIRPQRKGSYEAGPGLYMTTKLETAQKYRKGAGTVLEFTLSDDLLNKDAWLENRHIDLHTLTTFFSSVPRMSAKQDVIDGLEKIAYRQGHNEIAAPRLIALCVNNDALAGSAGVAVSDFLAQQGILASHCNNLYDEDWVTIFDPAAIVDYRALSASDHQRMGDQMRIQEAMEHAQAQALRDCPRG